MPRTNPHLRPEIHNVGGDPRRIDKIMKLHDEQYELYKWIQSKVTTLTHRQLTKIIFTNAENPRTHLDIVIRTSRKISHYSWQNALLQWPDYKIGSTDWASLPHEIIKKMVKYVDTKKAIIIAQQAFGFGAIRTRAIS
jgi:hypothetical protein